MAKGTHGIFKCQHLFLLLISTATLLATYRGIAQPKQTQMQAALSDSARMRDGQHDFDFEIGTWKTKLSRLTEPLSGSQTWVEYEGTTVVSKVFNGMANLVELTAKGPAGQFKGLSLRLYNPQAHQWSLNFANMKNGMLTIPTIGEFKNGKGEFYAQDTYNGRAILVKFVIAQINADSCRFEQFFSDDGGKTWELNWVAVDTRVQDAAGN
ncbi:hypothetical protein [uncultured Chitinophaga sp.]|jgi:hypothetical protein|uniref:hypothetical protein n=1 Tax=uncultured Chitinophaga sp. TaxID=339340 RepID=UPI00260331E3|nr:hypothetical protein [uncultured Chitinophaga sp.]